MKYLLEIIVFSSGASVMVLELVGVRILGPYVGTSMYVWSTLIGVFLGSLSIGYYAGGRLADKKPSHVILSVLLLAAGILIALSVLFREYLLTALSRTSWGTETVALIAAIVLFTPPSILLGAVSPYAAKLRMTKMVHAGKVVGNLSALSTLGSITGTFLAGFFLIPSFGSANILLLLAGFLIALATLSGVRMLWQLYAAALIIVLACSGAEAAVKQEQRKRNFTDLDTAYNRVWIMEGKEKNSGRQVRVMGINGENHSSMYLGSDELVNEYTKYFHLARHYNPGFTRTLMLGGAGYSFPKDFLKVYPAASMDVVEIDPQVTDLARQYFGLEDNPRLTIYHEDGRIFLNGTRDKYGVIFADAFSSRNSVPYHLTTREAFQKMYEALDDRGVVVMNVISAIEGEKGLFTRAEYKTLSDVFPEVSVLPVDTDDPYEVQNIIFVAAKSRPVSPVSDDTDIARFLTREWKRTITDDMPVLTDEYAPVDYYIAKTL